MMEDLLKKYQEMDPEKKAELDAAIDARSKGHLWFATPGAQLDAVNCLADVMLYGGTGGSGKTDLILGLAFEHHQRSLIVRKHYVDLTALTDRAKEINGTDKGYNGSIPPRLNTVNKKMIDFGGLAKLGDEAHWQGQAHDLLAIDEVVQNREPQVRFLMGWVRTTDPSQRCRVVFASNPPTDSSGDWIIPMFAPWLDNRHPNPAEPGELRYVVADEDGHDHWVDGPEPVLIDGRMQKPTSRTFIPGKLDDNPFLASDGRYAATLDALPEPLRSAIRDGNFMAARQDDPYQAIPTDWVRAAQDRWNKQGGVIPLNVPMCAIGVDAARSKDETVLAPRYDGFYPELIAVKGTETPHGVDVAALVIKHRIHDAMPCIDIAETNGAQAYAHLKENGIQCHGHLGVDKSVRRTVEKSLKFFNKRAEIYWRFREACDPNQAGGSPIMLPDDPMLISDLTAPMWDLTPQGIKLTSKRDVVKMLGRSPDRGDAVVLAWANGPKALTHALEWRQDQVVGTMAGRTKRRPAVNMGPRHGHGPRRR